MEAEIVNEETGEIIAPEADKSLIFGTKDPDGIIEKATKVANKLVDIVEKAKLYTLIKDKKYVRAEGWTTMAAMLGVFPAVESCQRLERADEIAYSSKVVLRTISGIMVGSGEAICSSAERSWGGRDEYAVKSMSQTRALGKACRISFSWIMALAGFEPTPAEEMVNETPQRQVALPRTKSPEPPVQGSGPLVQGVLGGVSEPGPDVQEADVVSPKSHEVGAYTDGARSKFWQSLQVTARKAKVNPETMKMIMKQMFHKDSSKDLLDGECTTIIKMIEAGKLK